MINQRQLIPLSALALGIGLAACVEQSPPQAAAPPPVKVKASVAPSVTDLVDARGSSGETALMSRGYINARTQGLTAFWWHPAGSCVRVVTANGRYKTVDPVAASNCGR